jgi:ABC-2 type transport system ATP-binding protein
MLEARGLVKRFGGVRAVNDVSFTVGPGEVLGYLGPNGSGKTTTMNMLTGLVEPSQGHVLFEGRDIHDWLVEYRARIGYVPEEPHLYSFLSGREYLELVGSLRGMPAGILSRKIKALLELLTLASEDDAPLSCYSKGMRQKVLVAAALIHDPDLVIFDEPTSGFDATSSMVFRHMVKALARSGKAIIYSSHELEAVEKVSTRVIVLHAGQVVAHDSVERLRDLMRAGSLEEVFAQLVMTSDPADTADRIVDAVTSRGIA